MVRIGANMLCTAQILLLGPCKWRSFPPVLNLLPQRFSRPDHSCSTLHHTALARKKKQARHSMLLALLTCTLSSHVPSYKLHHLTLQLTPVICCPTCACSRVGPCQTTCPGPATSSLTAPGAPGPGQACQLQHQRSHAVPRQAAQHCRRRMEAQSCSLRLRLRLQGEHTP